MAEWVTDIDADGVLEYHNIPEDGGTSSVREYIKPDTILEVGANSRYKTIQEAFNELSGKFCPGTITIKLVDNTYEITSTLVLAEPNSISSIKILGNGSTKIKKTVNANINEQVIMIQDQNMVELQGLVIEALPTNGSICVQNNGSKLRAKNLRLLGAVHAVFSTYNGGETELLDGIVIDNTTMCSFGFVASKGSRVTINNYPLTVKNCNVMALSEMAGITMMFFPQLTVTGVTTKFSPALNAHTGTGWNLGTEG